MNTAWWKSVEELDNDQQSFIRLPPSGRHLLIGPPGSGKTNLLLLRAVYIAKSGLKNVLILTYTNLLAGFIRSGIDAKELVASHQVLTFHKWAFQHIAQYLGGDRLDEIESLDNVAGRQALGRLLLEANRNSPSKYLYDAIFVDEAQDLTCCELEPLLELAATVCVCGDLRQSIYRIDGLKMDGLEIAAKSGLDTHELRRHYRIGPAIARVADRLLVPEDPGDSLDSTTNYNVAKSGDSTASLHYCASKAEQFDLIIKRLRVELVAFRGEMLGILCPRVEAIHELRDLFEDTDLKDKVAYHVGDGQVDFGSGAPIHVMSVHGSKGAEFRAVHIYRAEDFKFPLHHRELAYTAITRAKTALNAYCTGGTLKPIESAFAERQSVELTDLFGSAK